ncbi:MAG: hypothetical protein KDB14_19565 [Planctomycetales bacterium]|nr:hypothetical protein [Planctomycetales bacterium]
MRVQQFLEHHGIQRNPFAEEDAQTDPVFKEHCIESTYHPSWDKVYGDPREPSTSIVFGEKGSGKTAMRLQIARHVETFNEKHPDRRLLVVHYDDFNPFLDRFRDHIGKRNRRAEKVLEQWRLWDHMDCILSLAVTGLVDRVVEGRPSRSVDAEIDVADFAKLSRHQGRDLLLLAACYDFSTAGTFRGRWNALRKALRFHTWKSYWDTALGYVWSGAALMLIASLIWKDYRAWLQPFWLFLLLLLATVGWAPRLWRIFKSWRLAGSVLKWMRTGNRDRGALREAFQKFTVAELSGQPLPNKDSTDDRYELLMKFQDIAATLGYPGVIVLVDRVDEPHLINGSAELMQLLLWPMLDNKFLKHPGIGMKLMLPIELTRFIEREDRAFYQRSRLDKQNVVSSFEWTGEALYDVANARIAACSSGTPPKLRDLLDESVTMQRLLDALRELRVPRHLFKFLYRLVVAHCNAHTDAEPVWKIPAGAFEATLAIALRDQDAFDRGMGAG